MLSLLEFAQAVSMDLEATLAAVDRAFAALS